MVRQVSLWRAAVRFLQAIARTWVVLMMYALLALIIGGVFAMVGVIAHGWLDAPKDATVVACLMATFVTTGAVIVEERAPRGRP